MQLTKSVLVTAYYTFREIENVNTQVHFLKKEKLSKHIFDEAGPFNASTGYIKKKPVNLIKNFYEKSKPEVNFKQKLEMNKAVTASYADC